MIILQLYRKWFCVQSRFPNKWVNANKT